VLYRFFGTVGLVSCKYYTKSDKSVGVDDEVNILERLKQHRCDGFMGFYSTIGSSHLIDRLREFASNGTIS
jgi:hypothetical protein